MIDLEKLSAAELDELLAKAAEKRAEIEPKVSGERPTGTVKVFGAEAWYTEPSPHGMLIQLRHPGHGWVSLIISPEHRVQLLHYMLQQAIEFGPTTKPSTAETSTETAPGSGGRHLH